jgi:hypothetical protein
MSIKRVVASYILLGGVAMGRSFEGVHMAVKEDSAWWLMASKAQIYGGLAEQNTVRRIRIKRSMPRAHQMHRPFLVRIRIHDRFLWLFQ